MKTVDPLIIEIYTPNVSTNRLNFPNRLFTSDRDLLGAYATERSNGACSIRNGGYKQDTKEQRSVLVAHGPRLQ